MSEVRSSTHSTPEEAYVNVSDKFTGGTNSLVELKTSLTIRGPHDEARFEK